MTMPVKADTIIRNANAMTVQRVRTETKKIVVVCRNVYVMTVQPVRAEAKKIAVRKNVCAMTALNVRAEAKKIAAILRIVCAMTVPNVRKAAKTTAALFIVRRAMNRVRNAKKATNANRQKMNAKTLPVMSVRSIAQGRKSSSVKRRRTVAECGKTRKTAVSANTAISRRMPV